MTRTATSTLVLGDLVAQEDLGLELLSGGAEALDREIAGAHSIDVEAPTRFLERGWVMLTAGMRLRGNPGAQRALIAELQEGEIAALGIGIDVVFKHVPPALLEEARARAFPVFAVPLETPFRDIVGFINRSLLSSDLRTYQRLTAMQRHLIDALREPEPRRVVVDRLARMLDAGVLVLGGDGRPELSAGSVPDPGWVWQRISAGEPAVHEFDEEGWHTVAVPIVPAPSGAPSWLVLASRRRALAARLARPAAQATVPLLAATERLGELARDQERAVRSALLEEALELSAPPRPRMRPEVRGLAARAASFGLDFTEPARVALVSTVDAADPLEQAAAEAGVPHLVSTRDARTVALLQGPRALELLDALPGAVGIGRAFEAMAGVPVSFRDAELALERVAYEPGRRRLAYEDFDVCTLLLSEVPAEHIRGRVEDLLAPLRANPPLLEALVEYFARGMDVAATAEAMHVHPNTLRYRLARVEKLIGRSLRQPTTIADLTIALMAR